MILLDKIILSLLIISFIFGWFRGFLRSLIGPLSFAICTFFAILFYDINSNVLVACLIIILGSIGLSIVLSILMTIALASVNKEYRGKVFLMSRICGATTNLAWQGNLMFGLLLLAATIPANGTKMEELQKQIYQSQTIKLYYQHIVRHYPEYEAVILSLEDFQEPSAFEKIKNMPEFKTFSQDKKVKEFLNNPELITAVDHQNYLSLAKNPILKDFLTDDNAMNLFTKLAKRIYRENLEKLRAPTPTATPKK